MTYQIFTAHSCEHACENEWNYSLSSCPWNLESTSCCKVNIHNRVWDTLMCNTDITKTFCESFPLSVPCPFPRAAAVLTPCVQGVCISSRWSPSRRRVWLSTRLSAPSHWGHLVGIASAAVTLCSSADRLLISTVRDLSFFPVSDLQDNFGTL